MYEPVAIGAILVMLAIAGSFGLDDGPVKRHPSAFPVVLTLR